MLCREIKPEWIEEAKRKAKKLGILNNSITEGEGNICGFIGELMVADLVKGEIKNTYDYDILKKNIAIDVKTKRCTSEPKDFYECSVAAFNTNQKCHFYVFCRILENLKKGWICGIIRKDDYYKQSTFHKKGEYDPSNDWYFKADCYNLKIKDLIKFEDYIKVK